ncbi:DUF373 family protein [Halorutilales archaeon Cl-col2-1]
MLLIICVDRDDDIGRKTGIETPVIGRDRAEEVALEFGTADPEDSDLNALFEAMRIYDNEEGEAEIVVVTGSGESRVDSDRAVAQQIDEVLEHIDADSAVVVTDGAEDETIIPLIQSRLKIDGVSRTIVRQAQNLENAYYITKQLLRDPETRGTILVPIGLLLMIYPLNLIAGSLGYPGVAVGVTSGLLGIYLLIRGVGLGDKAEILTERVQRGIYSGNVSLITYLVAGGLLLIGIASGFNSVDSYSSSSSEVVEGLLPMVMVFIRGSILWLTFGGIVSSVGRILDEYIESDEYPWRFMNAPFYIVSIALVLRGISEFLLGNVSTVYLVVLFVVSIGIGTTSTVLFGGISSSEKGVNDEVIEID